MKHAVRFPEVSSRRLRIVMGVAAVLVVLALLWYAGRFAQEGQRADTRTDERNAAVGAAEQVIDCVQDPSTETTDECEAEAQQAQETLEEEVPPVNLTKRQRGEVVLIASELIAADPDLSEADVVDEVLARLPAPEQGDRGRQGPAGADTEPPSTGEIRDLVEAVYADDPPPPGDDGKDGTAGTSGADGKDGKDATPEMVDAAVARYCSVRGECVGPRGADGPAGPAGADGAAGRGIAAMSCDPDTQLFVVTYTDGSSQAISGSDCIADGPLPGLG